jgi:hypothetical protein
MREEAAAAQPRPPPLLLSMPRQPPQLIARRRDFGTRARRGNLGLGSRDTRQSGHGSSTLAVSRVRQGIGKGMGGYRQGSRFRVPGDC